jgi:hypothetical protein
LTTDEKTSTELRVPFGSYIEWARANPLHSPGFETAVPPRVGGAVFGGVGDAAIGV